MIEARGARYPYAVVDTGVSSRWRGGENRVGVAHTHGFLVADSDDEAVGKALTVSRLLYPADLGWTFRDFHVIPLAGIDWVTPPDPSTIQPLPPH